MRVGIVGIGWGRTHCGTFRAAGCEVVALLGQRRDIVERVAAEEGVPIAATDPAALDSCDVIVVASPTDNHLDQIRRFRHKPIFCEKPLTPRPLDASEIDELGAATVFVNYAFPFLDSARRLDGLLAAGRLGSIERVILQVGVRFAAEKSPIGWFHDVVVHPLSWLVHRLGDGFALRHGQVGRGRSNVVACFDDGRRLLDVALYARHREGLHFDLLLVGDAGTARLAGGFAPSRGWRFRPLVLDGDEWGDGEGGGPERGGGERSGGEDIWYRANRRAVGQFCTVVRGHESLADALASGSFDLRKAAAIERMLAPMLVAEAA
ncbi:MAG: Gfo/Idh/MocA family oxidoreductase [Acidobacteriota bacterium]